VKQERHELPFGVHSPQQPYGNLVVGWGAWFLIAMSQGADFQDVINYRR
jgi:hypothetical protein